jgi:hypothetical protein
MEKKNIELNIISTEGKVEILEGKAPEQKPLFRKTPYQVLGGPGTVLEIVNKEPQKSDIEAHGHDLLNDLSDCDQDIFLSIDRDNFKIKLSINKVLSTIIDEYTSALVLSKELKEFGINTGKEYTTFELAQFIKMNRTCFESKTKAMELVSLLQNFKAKVDKDIQNADDTRGNRKMLLQQTVDSNIPEAFSVTIPIFKGIERQTIEVEIMIDATDLSCQLVSPEAKDFIDTQAREIMDDEINKIKELHPNLKVVEVI